MKCKDCNCAKKGFFSYQPEAYVCIGVKEPFVIGDINSECTEYESKRNMKTTREKAIRDIQRLSGLCKFGGDCMSCDICYNAVPKAIADMEKQIPKKTVKLLDVDVKVNWNSCPTCKQGIGWGKQRDVNYCWNCGQALDWSDNIEN